ncbi:N-acyl amino acid synthase FeeM domain-containing protein [Pseudomonas ficuserectae]|uniref:N-acyl amino acid synthase FeeM domain-containing protein n=2 Tax=Pseudomonas syringae group genomosp. 2 TaxID=251698 RepID=UPI00211C2094|nr:hypothetical protein [Pseudomonas ficuserectae]
MKNIFSGITVRLSESLQDKKVVHELRINAYAKYELSNNGKRMGFDATDEYPWVDSLIAFQKNEPIGTMRIIRANRDTIDRLLGYELWKDHIDQCISNSSPNILEFSRFAITGGGNFPIAACALLKATMAIQTIENIDFVTGEVRANHAGFYKKFIGMVVSEEVRTDPNLQVDYSLLTGYSKSVIGKLQQRKPWMVPTRADIDSWKQVASISW